MADVLLLLPSPAAAERVHRALRLEAAAGVDHVLRPARGWAELTDLAARAPLALAFVDPYHGGGFAAAELRRLGERFPRTAVVAYADFAARPASDAFTLALLGVRAVLALDGGDHPAALRQCLTDHLNAAPLDAVAARLAEAAPPRLRHSLQAVVRSAGAPATVAGFAALARCSPRTLRRALRAAGLPAPEQLLAWRRLLHAARLLEDGRSADSVARTLDFSSGSALRKSLRLATGLRPREVVASGGLAFLAERFLAACGGSAERALAAA
ncbi:MAG TPA: helix-turn-helix domain-containing protein [Longimicrobiaceae bacterium]|nr:helix-turn-helix domain-containing protein [Longimicrobiaceae bacterium]